MNIKELYKKIFWKTVAVPFIRKPYIKKWRDSYNYDNSAPSIISSNCIGGEIYNDLGLRFTSPLINTFLDETDMLKIAKNPQHYFNTEIEFIKSDMDYPVGKIDDVTVYFRHYKTETEAAEKWYERCKRVDYDRLYLIMSDLKLSEDEITEFQNIKNVHKKIMFTCNTEHKGMEHLYFVEKYIPNSYIRAYANNRNDGFRDFEHFFDFTSWLND